MRNDIQIIIIDDCSPGFNSYKDRFLALPHPCIEVYSTEIGGSAGRARNVGLEYAKGDWLIFADADDFFVDNFTNILDEYANSHADVIIFDSRSVMSEDLSIASRRSPRSKDIKQYDGKNNTRLRYYTAQPWGRMIRRSLVEENHIRFSETKYANDRYFSVSCSVLAKDFLPVNKVMYIVTEREGSLAHSLTSKKLRISSEEAKIRFCESFKTHRFICKHVKRADPSGLLLGMNIFAHAHLLDYYKTIFTAPSKYISIYPYEIKRLANDIKKLFK